MRLIARVDELGGHRPLVQRALEAGAKLRLAEVGARAVALHHLRHPQLDRLVGGEALAAGGALAPAADRVARLRDARVDHLGVGAAAERALHGAGGDVIRGTQAQRAGYGRSRRAASARLAIDRELRRQRATCPRTFAIAASSAGSSSTSAIRWASCLRLELAEAARGDRRAADADAGGDERLLRIVRDRVLVDRDVRLAPARPRRPCR